MRRLVLGTAGHIDHGKTALVRALTGVDTDRLPEEKRRGMTIDLGFAELQVDQELRFSIIDVPGHEAFVRNMVAGATGIDLVLLVIAADESVMPQTREHLAIIEMLGVDHGVIALTKSDLVDDEWLGLVRDEVAELIDGTSLADAPIIPVSARTGAGLEDLVAALGGIGRNLRPRGGPDLFRMPIDRVFTVRGTGTVVTGTVWSGSLQQDRQVRIEPAGITGRLRGLQQHGEECESISAGSRAAVALGNVERSDIGRGDAVLVGDGWAAGTILTLDLAVLRDASAALKPRQRLRVHIGTAETIGRLALLGQPLEPGGRAIVQLRLEEPVIARAGDRAVIRTWSPVRTVAGGTVLEPQAGRRKRLDAATTLALRQVAMSDTALAGVVSLAGDNGIPLEAAPVLTGLTPDEVRTAVADTALYRVEANRVLPAGPIAACAERLLQHIRAWHVADPLADGPGREELRRVVADTGDLTFDVALEDLIGSGTVTAIGNAVALTDHEHAPTREQRQALDDIGSAYETAGLLAPDVQDLPAPLSTRPDLPLLLRHLERSGALVRLTPTRWCSANAVNTAAEHLHITLGRDAQPVAAYKDALGLTRKHLMPLLEYFDREGVSRRDGDLRTLTAQRPV